MNSLKNCSDARHSSIRTGHRLPLKMRVLLIPVVVCALIIPSCGPSKEEMEYREKAAEMAFAVSDYKPGIVTDTIGGMTHNFIKTASLKCRMSNVLSATKTIEDLVALNGGYASKSDLVSTVNYSNTIHFAKDSVLEQTFYTTSNSLSLRIPAKQLDTILRKITDLAVFVDYRTLRSDDVKMKLFANSLTEARLQAYKKSVSAKVHSKETKLNHAVAAEENMFEKQTASDETQVESFSLADQINYSTLVVELYESQKSSSQKLALPLVIKPYEDSFIQKFGVAFLKGFEILKNFVLFIAESWSVFFIMILLFILAKKGIAFYNKRYVTDVK